MPLSMRGTESIDSVRRAGGADRRKRWRHADKRAAPKYCEPMLSSLLLLALASPPAPTVYVQASKIKLRASAATDAAVVVELPIGSACTVIKDGPPWVKLECSGKIGFTKFELVGDSPPQLADQIALAENRGLPVADRLTGAQRALALQATDQTRALLRTLFFDAEHALLAQWKDFEPVELVCALPLAACLDAELGRSGSTVAIDVRAASFVAVVARAEGELFMIRGIERSRGKDGESGEQLVRLDVGRSRAPRDEPFERAIFAGARAGASSPRGAPLSRAQRKQLAGLPTRWVSLTGEPGARFVQRSCSASTPSKHLVIGMLGEVTLLEDVGQETLERIVTDLVRDKAGIELTLASGDRVTLAWPTSEKHVGTWGTDAFTDDVTAFVVKKDTDDCDTP